MTTTNELGSGCEVESAAFRDSIPERTGFRARVDEFRARSLGKVSSMKSSLTTRSVAMRDEVQTSMRTSPMLWAGIAAGSGFAIGLVGRFVQWRNRQRRQVPHLVVIEASC
jgi:hypothetical protein